MLVWLTGKLDEVLGARVVMAAMVKLEAVEMDDALAPSRALIGMLSLSKCDVLHLLKASFLRSEAVPSP